MDPARWRRVRELVEAALEAPESGRQALLDSACAGDAALRAEVDALITSHARAGGLLESPVAVGEAFEDQATLASGDRVGAYVIEQEIGRGGMGVVYRAWDTRLERRVALKALSPALPADEDARERLRREARAAGRLSHEAIATVYALEEADAGLFIASEYVEGQTLGARLAAGRLAAGEALGIARAVARGLAAAHDRGVVHRDLKPDNILLTGDGRVKIVDFGIASVEGLGRGLTRTGMVLGTPGYMAPEQLSGLPADARSDVFALGVVLYEMLAGRTPFGRGASWSAVAAVLERDPAPLGEAAADVPPALEQVVFMCLAKAPGSRYPTAGALADALDALATGHTPRTPVATAEAAPEPHGVWWLQFHQLAATLALALVMIPGWMLMGRLHRLTGRALVVSLLVLAAWLGTLRLHLWFTSRHDGAGLAAEIARVGRTLRWGNRAFAALLGLGGIGVMDGSPELGAVTAACAAATLAAGEFIEPAALARALGRRAMNPRAPDRS